MAFEGPKRDHSLRRGGSAGNNVLGNLISSRKGKAAQKNGIQTLPTFLVIFRGGLGILQPMGTSGFRSKKKRRKGIAGGSIAAAAAAAGELKAQFRQEVQCEGRQYLVASAQGPAAAAKEWAGLGEGERKWSRGSFFCSSPHCSEGSCRSCCPSSRFFRRRLAFVRPQLRRETSGRITREQLFESELSRLRKRREFLSLLSQQLAGFQQTTRIVLQLQSCLSTQKNILYSIHEIYFQMHCFTKQPRSYLHFVIKFPAVLSSIDHGLSFCLRIFIPSREQGLYNSQNMKISLQTLKDSKA
nr:uncharacterized protein LOC110082640 [Pogona vitticeps]